MADPIKVWYAVTGDGELVTQLMTMGSRVNAAAKAVLKECGDEMAARIEAAAPVRSGQLRESIDPSGVYKLPSGAIEVRVRPWGRRRGRGGKEVGNYAIGLFSENGLAAIPQQWVRGHRENMVARRVEFKNGKVRRGEKIYSHGAGYYRSRPAIAARPFFGPAIEAMRGQFAGRIDAALARALKAENASSAYDTP